MRIIFIYVLSIIVLFWSGCRGQTATPKTGNSKAKLTLEDLKAPNAYKFQPNINFDIVKFSVPASSIADIQKAFSLFKSENIKIRNPELLKQNGLAVYSGKSDQSTAITTQLQYLNAKRISRIRMSILEDIPEFLESTSFFSNIYLFSINLGNQEISRQFSPGKIGWLFTSSSTSQKDIVNLSLDPVYVPLAGTSIRLAAGVDEYRHSYFPQGHFECILQEGDFVILAPNRINNRITLDRMLFTPFPKEDLYFIDVVIFLNSS